MCKTDFLIEKSTKISRLCSQSVFSQYTLVMTLCVIECELTRGVPLTSLEDINIGKASNANGSWHRGKRLLKAKEPRHATH